MPFNLDDLIVAAASPPGAAARGIVRVSGREVVSLVDRLLDSTVPRSGPPLRISGQMLAKTLGSPLPASVLLWPNTRSYTGQPMAEFHVLGSPPILELVVEAIIDSGARLAERGEFTMRAFLNGRIDLLQAEAVLGVIDAADHDELQSALTQLGGGLTQQLQDVRSVMVAILGDLEAGLDFVEEDIEFISSAEMIQRLIEARAVLTQLLHDSRERLPSGYRPRVVLAGLPNAGKSTLFNRLAGADLAITATTAGTTRDYLSCSTTVAGATIELVDTAGWDSATDDVMEAAQGRRYQQLDRADLVLWCRAADLPIDGRITDAALRRRAQLEATWLISIATCVDRVPAIDKRPEELGVSAESGDGLNELKQLIADTLKESRAPRGELLATTSLRCRDSLHQTLQSIDSAVDSASRNLGDEITAISLREALRELRSILGETWTDDILDHIFGNFCIGK